MKISSIRVIGFVMFPVLLLVFYLAIPESSINDVFDSNVVFTESVDDISEYSECVELCDKPLDFDPSALALDIINNIPESNDSKIVQLLDEAELLSKYDIIISRILGADESEISKLTLSKTLDFVTAQGGVIDLRNVDFGYSFSIKGDKDVMFGSALVEILVNDKPVHEKRYDLKGIINNGMLKIYTDKQTIASLLGFASDGDVKIDLKIKEFYIRNADGLYSLLEPTIIHSLILEKDSNQILYKNEEGKVVKMYPVDDKLYIYAIPSNVVHSTPVCNGGSRGVCYVWYFNAISYDQLPHVGSITILDEFGNQLKKTDYFPGITEKIRVDNRDPNTGRGSTGDTISSKKLVDIELQRNSKYTVKVGSPQNTEFVINTPKSQHNFVYECSTAYGCNFKSFP